MSFLLQSARAASCSTLRRATTVRNVASRSTRPTPWRCSGETCSRSGRRHLQVLLALLIHGSVPLIKSPARHVITSSFSSEQISHLTRLPHFHPRHIRHVLLSAGFNGSTRVSPFFFNQNPQIFTSYFFSFTFPFIHVFRFGSIPFL